MNCSYQVSLGSFIHGYLRVLPNLHRLDMTAPNGILNRLSSGERSQLFTQLVSHCPRLNWLDVNVRMLKDNDRTGPLKIHWPEERQILRILYHHQQPEEGSWLEPWHFFKGNVRVVDDPEEIRESKKGAEGEWIVSPYLPLA